MSDEDRPADTASTTEVMLSALRSVVMDLERVAESAERYAKAARTKLEELEYRIEDGE